jgi:hypothetical protein
VAQIVIDSKIEESSFVSYFKIDVDKYIKGLWDSMIASKTDTAISVDVFVVFLYDYTYTSREKGQTKSENAVMSLTIYEEDKAERGKKW